MVKPAGPGVYSATYSNIPVYEYQFGEGLKEHVMRRRGDNWINATHILKAAGFDKPARTRILEREVQKETHEKVQGGYGKYQGTWVPLPQGIALAQRNNVYDKLRMIFEFSPGNLSPPPAPKHTTAKPKLTKKPAVPKFAHIPAPSRVIEDDYDNISAQLNDDESMADDITVASASFIADDDRYDMSQQGTGHRKRKHDEMMHAAHQAHIGAHQWYSDALLDYFMANTANKPVSKPEPPINFDPDWTIDGDNHSALHWGAAMGDLGVVKELIKHGANLGAANIRGETPLMRAVMFTNCQEKEREKDVMNQIVRDLFDTIEMVDDCQSTALHHAAMLSVSRQKIHCSRYYLDVLLNNMENRLEPERFQKLLDAQDMNGNTAIHLAAMNSARKCVRALQGRGANTQILNNQNRSGEDLIREMQARPSRNAARSSSPYAPDYHERHMPEDTIRDRAHVSEAAMSIESKVIPALQDKLDDLAASFDEAIKEKEVSENAAKRIHKTTSDELRTTSNNILELQLGEDKQVEERRKGHLSHQEQEITNLIEQQQILHLRSRIQHEQNTTNGHLMSDDDLIERALLAQQLMAEQATRIDLIRQYIDGLGLAGAGEKGELARKLISTATGPDINMLDVVMLDNLIGELRDDEHGREGEIIHPDDL